MASDLASTLDRAARLFGLHLTVVGHHDRLHRGGKVLIGRQQQSHRTQRVCDLGFGPQCTAHCRWEVNHRLAWRPQPFVTCCWKGLREIAVPLRWAEQHLGVLYAGTWRQANPPRSAKHLPQGWSDTWRTLPVWEERLLDEFAPVLELFAAGLAQRLSTEIAAGSGGRDHATVINTWFQVHAQTPVGIADCAEYLGLSVSRTGALVRQHCGESFALVLRRHRLARACVLLHTTNDPIAVIARACGFDDPAWFSRVFAAAHGRSPRSWRRQGAGAAPGATLPSARHGSAGATE